MITTLEDKLFEEFKPHGAAAQCLDYVREVILNEGSGFLDSQSWREYYDSVPTNVAKRTKAFDDAAWPINVKGRHRIAQEISDNLEELKSESRRERYIIKILEVFEDWAKAFTPCAQIQTMEQAIQRHSAYDFHSESDYIKAIEQIRGLHDRLLEVMDNKKYGEIANHFEHWYRAYYFFCDMLAAELAKHNINILEIQNKRGIWLVEKLDVLHLQLYFGMDGNYNYANSLLNALDAPNTLHLITIEDNGVIHNRASTTLFFELPKELDTPAARKYFGRAYEGGMIDPAAKKRCLIASVRLGYICSKVYSSPRPISALEKYFGISKLSASISQAEYEAKRADVIKWRKDIDVKIFFD